VTGVPQPPTRSPARGAGGSRLAAARRRAQRAKVVVTAGGVAIFGVALVLARASYASHAKHPVQPLTVPRTFVDTVHDDLLRAGIVAPPQAPPQVETATS